MVCPNVDTLIWEMLQRVHELFVMMMVHRDPTLDQVLW